MEALEGIFLVIVLVIFFIALGIALIKGGGSGGSGNSLWGGCGGTSSWGGCGGGCGGGD